MTLPDCFYNNLPAFLVNLGLVRLQCERAGTPRL